MLKKEKNTGKDIRKNRHEPANPAPLSGSKKTKKKNHVSDTHGEGS